MTTSVLPSSPIALSRAKWEDIVPYFDELAERPIDPGSIESWLQAWSTLEELVTEAAAVAMIAYTIDTADPEKEADHLRFSTEILPKMEERSVELARRLVDSGYSTPAIATTLARFRTAIAIFREANVPIFAELEELSARYQRITGSMTVEWDGEERPLPQLQPYLKSPDREVRERAFRTATQPYIDQHRPLARPVRSHVRPAPARRAQRGLRQFPGLHLSGEVPVRLLARRLRAVPRRRRARRCARRRADAGSPPQTPRAGRATALGPVGGSLSSHAAPSLRRRAGIRGQGTTGLRSGGSGAGRRVPDDDRRAASSTSTAARARHPAGIARPSTIGGGRSSS